MKHPDQRMPEVTEHDHVAMAPRLNPEHSSEALRAVALDAIRAAAGLAPFTLGTGYDSNGEPIRDPEGTLDRALQCLESAGRTARDLRLGRS